MTSRLALLVVVAGCWTDAGTPPQTPIGAIEPRARRNTDPPPAEHEAAVDEARVPLDEVAQAANAAASVVPGFGGPPTDPAMRDLFTRNRTRFDYCVNKQRLATPTLRGSGVMSFTITPSGTLTDIHVVVPPGPMVPLAKCLENVLATSIALRPMSGLSKITYPFYFPP